MPTVLRAHGLRFMIFTDDHPPAHVHVRGRGELRIGLGEACPVLTNKGTSEPDTARARNAVLGAREDMPKIWTEIHGRAD